VFYDGLTLKQMMDNVRQDKLKKEQEIVEKEKEFEKQLVSSHKEYLNTKLMLNLGHHYMNSVTVTN
jgi:hypothetical protein